MFLARTVAHTVDVDGMLARITPEQFNEWLALYNIEPWGDDWWQAASIQAAILNTNQSDPISVADLIPTRANLERNSSEVDESQLAATWRTRIGVK